MLMLSHVTDFKAKTLATKSGWSVAVWPGNSSRGISSHRGLQVIVMKRLGAPNFRPDAIASWKSCAICLFPPTNEDGRMTCRPMCLADKPVLTAFAKPWWVSAQMVAWFIQTNLRRFASTVTRMSSVYSWKLKQSSHREKNTQCLRTGVYVPLEEL